ncbi:SDR family NAD(P)-dependent oxidoreductase [Streptomyces sp. NPDC048506]|uniref:SDR family NAD(P)-dependent oxidoreductase n=1 Tax=Streptomyces sp. NPDC048506 TaxID=3155028 RepID=UPI003412A0DE
MSRITTPYGFSSTAAEVAHGIDLTGRRALVTGASSGLGAETARALAGTGAAVTLAVCDVPAGERVAKDITEATGNQDLHVAHLDLADPASVAAFTTAWQGPLHILVNNAGVMACPEQYTEQGWEWQFATNHLGHFALATSALLEGIGGRYFIDCNETETVDRRTGTLHGVARYALDPAGARRLWTLSQELLADAA